MNKGLKRVLQIGIPIVVVGIILIPRLDFSSSDSADDSPKTAASPRAASRGALPVTGIVASLATSSTGIPVTGSLVANEEVELVSETAGKIVEIAFKEGARVKKGDLLVKVDDSDNSMGWKCAEYEMKGVPLRVECGPRDLENNQCVLVRRTDREKVVVSLDELEAAAKEQLELVQKGMYERAKKNLDDHIYEAHSLEEAKELQEKNGGFVKTMWCGDLACELKKSEAKRS